jgi:long-chain acyl-CoA synthetase
MSPSEIHPISTTLSGRHLVISGITGFVGKVWLSHLLTHSPDIGRVTLLVRGSRGRTAIERVAHIADTSPAFRPVKAVAGSDYAAWLDARLDVVQADITKPRCGLDEATYQRITATADCVIHIAGLTDFQPDPRIGFPANVDGTRHMAALARRTPSRRLIHMSTCFVAGMAEGQTPEQLTVGRSPLGQEVDVDAECAAVQEILDQNLDASQRIDAVMERARHLGWPNLYTYTKGLAEHLLASDDALDLTIVRPSVVECARTFPFPGWNEGLNTSAPIMWFCGTPFRRFPATPHHHFDIIPVDTVCRWLSIITARHLHGEARPVYQFCSSDINPTTFGRIFELTALAHRREANGHGASLRDRIVAQLDIVPTHLDKQGTLQPKRIAGFLGGLRERVNDLHRQEGLAGRMLATLGADLRSTRRQLRLEHRRMNQLQKMFDAYRPFVHDHDWVFCSQNIRDTLATLHPDDQQAFGDDITDMCWRTYWLEVQFPGIKRWSFPIIDGQQVPLDPPSSPPLALDSIRGARIQGAA